MNPSFKSDMLAAQMEDSVSIWANAAYSLYRFCLLFTLIGSAIAVTLYSLIFWHDAWWVFGIVLLYAANKVYHLGRPAYDRASTLTTLLAAVPAENHFWFKRWHHNWELNFDASNPAETEQEMPYLYWERNVDYTWKNDLFTGMNPYDATMAYMKRDPEGFKRFVAGFPKNNDIKGVF